MAKCIILNKLHDSSESPNILWILALCLAIAANIDGYLIVQCCETLHMNNATHGDRI